MDNELCACGCGLPLNPKYPFNPCTGEPTRFRVGHHFRSAADGESMSAKAQERHGTAERNRQIKEMVAAEGAAAAGRRFGISRQRAYQIATGRAMRSVPDGGRRYRGLSGPPAPPPAPTPRDPSPLSGESGDAHVTRAWTHEGVATLPDEGDLLERLRQRHAALQAEQKPAAGLEHIHVEEGA